MVHITILQYSSAPIFSYIPTKAQLWSCVGVCLGCAKRFPEVPSEAPYMLGSTLSFRSVQETKFPVGKIS